MTTPHTAGPWRVFDAFTDLEIVTDQCLALETESLVQFKGQRNAKANARLMAARNVSTTLRQPAFEFKLGFPAFGLAG
jgi:hypothetical protein